MKSFSLLLALAAAPVVMNQPTARAERTAGCAIVGRADSAAVLQDTRFMASRPEASALRATHGIPNVHVDSVQFLAGNGEACDIAALSYKVHRVAASMSDVLIPILLIRLGTSNVFLGSLRISENRLREYVVLDSTYAVTSRFRVGP